MVNKTRYFKRKQSLSISNQNHQYQPQNVQSSISIRRNEESNIQTTNTNHARSIKKFKQDIIFFFMAYLFSLKKYR